MIFLDAIASQKIQISLHCIQYDYTVALVVPTKKFKIDLNFCLAESFPVLSYLSIVALIFQTM
jgi:hypothetical protein